MSACKTHVRLSVDGSARSFAYAVPSCVSSDAVSALIDFRNTTGRLSLPGLNGVPPLGAMGHVGGFCANAFHAPPEKGHAPAAVTAAALCRNRRRLEVRAGSPGIIGPPKRSP